MPPTSSPRTKHERRVQWFLMKDTQLFQSFFVKESAAVAVPVMKRRRMSSRSVISALCERAHSTRKMINE